MSKQTIAILKIKSDTKYAAEIQDAINSKSYVKYCTQPSDISTAEKLLGNCQYIVVFKFDENYKTTNMYIGKLDQTGLPNDLKYNEIKEIENENMYNNVISLIELDLKNDFVKRSYLSYETSSQFIKQIIYIYNEPYECPYNPNVIYSALKEEESLHDLAQKNEYCVRKYSKLSSNEGRGEFQRDYERIVHSKAFRRMVDKAQVFSASKGDYYRTRMTHTLTVVQIAKGISNSLGLNLYLTEAIAMGHDLGHTPFGHQGERTLNNILDGTINGIIKVENKEEYDFGGFKHNYQSVRVVDSLEEEYAEYCGLDLSYQTLEGIFKHTKGRSDIDMGSFVDSEVSNSLYLNYPDFSTTLEGQVVAIADEIAQRGHDLDDAFASGLLTISELLEKLSIQKTGEFLKSLKSINEDLEDLKLKQRNFVDENELRNNRFVSKIIGFLIEDVIENSKNGLKYSIEEFKRNENRVIKKIIDFTDDGKKINDYLEKIISNKVINSSEVSLFDDKASRIVRELFRAYYNNPKLLHNGTLQRIRNEIRMITTDAVDLVNGDHKIIKKEIEFILNRTDNKDNKESLYSKKHKILVRCICDYIAGMTDTYAINEYNRIYRVCI